jgi:hypothetical protein
MKLKKTNPLIHYCFILLTFAGVLLVAPVNVQSQTMPPDRDNDVTRRQLAGFDNFLDSHPEVAEQLRKDPSLVNNQQFVGNHPALQEYLQQHPEVQEEISQNPNAFMRREERYDRREDQRGDRDITRTELANMDRFMDSHPEIAEQLRKDPSLVDNKQFVEGHPELRQFLADHPGVREEYKENPNAFMRQEERFDRREDQRGDRDITRTELANMDRFMDSHPEIAEQLRKDPSLVDNKQFVEGHPALRQFLADHPGVREEYKENPNAFMRQEERYDRREDQRGDRDITRTELANMDRFMDSHPEIAEQLRKDPSLVDNREFVANHPALQQFLADHPGVREEYKEHPEAFMRMEERFDRREDSMRRDRDVTSGELASFNQFLGGHDKIADELSKNPTLANNQEYLENHPALKDYLRANPQVHEELSENPQTFIKSAEQFDPHGTPKMPGETKPIK